MAVGTAYQGAWQQVGYQGAWQLQAGALTKSLSDALAISDAAPVMAVGKNVTDAVSMSEARAFGISKPLTDTLGFSETFAKAVGLPFAENVAMADVKSLAFAKSLSDSLNLLETIVVGGNLFFSEAFAISDATAFVLNRSFGETMTIADAATFVRGYSQRFSDALAISDAIAFVQTYARSFGETMAIVDSIVFVSSKDVADTMAISDAFASVTAKSFADTMSISDSALVFSITKALSELFSSTDSIFKSLEIGEQLASQKDIAELLADPRSEVRPWMPWVAIGSSNIESNELYETALWEELHRKLGDVSVTANTYFVRATFGQDEPTADDLTIYEIGIFDAATDGVMGKRWVLNTGVDKDNIDEIVVECAVTILHGTIQEIQALFNLAPGAEAIVEDNITQQPVDVQPISDRISFQLDRNLSLNDTLPISDVITSMDLSKRFTDNMSISDSFSSSLNGLPPGFEHYGTPIYNDVIVNSPYAYVLTSGAVAIGVASGMLILDVSDVTFPTRVIYFEFDPLVYGLGHSGARMQKVGDIIYVVSGRGLYSIDVSDPANPVQLDYLLAHDGIGFRGDIAIQGSIAYLGFYYEGVRLVDISDPSNLVRIPMNMFKCDPRMLGIDPGTCWPEDWETELLYRYTGLAENPNGPDPYYSPSTPPLFNSGGGDPAGWMRGDFISDIRVSGSLMYMLLRSGLWIAPIAAPYSLPAVPGASGTIRPTMICTCAHVPNVRDQSNVPNSFDLVGTTAYLYQTGVTVFPNPRLDMRLVEIDTVANTVLNNTEVSLSPNYYAFNIWAETLVVGDYIYVNETSGLNIFDKTAFTEVGYVPGYRQVGKLDSGFRGMTVYDDHLYVCWFRDNSWVGPSEYENHEVRIYDLVDKANPVMVGSWFFDQPPIR